MITQVVITAFLLYFPIFFMLHCNSFVRFYSFYITLYYLFLYFYHFLDCIDLVKEYDGQLEENPKLFKSEVTGRGPLVDSWIDDLKKGGTKGSKMCAYKLCKVKLFQLLFNQNDI